MTRPNAIGIRKPAIGLVAAFAVICGVSQSRMPELISFREAAPKHTSFVPSSAPSLQTVAFERKPSTLLEPKKAVHARVNAARKPVVQPVTEPDAIQAKADDAPSFLIERVAAQQQDFPAPQTMFVVFQSQQYRAGQMQWTVYVWQVSMTKSALAPLPARRT